MKSRSTKDQPLVDVCSMLLQQVPKPARYEMCRAINVYDNRYRINIYAKEYDSIYDIDKRKIAQSYFCHLEDAETLRIVSPKI